MTSPFAALGIQKRLCDTLPLENFPSATPVQELAIPKILQGKDLRIQAPTGTGKTLAYLLPLLEKLQAMVNPEERLLKAVVLVPTREIAEQVHAKVMDSRKFLKVQSMVLLGGVSMEKQENKLETGVELVVATPGRLLDLEQRGSLSLKSVEFLIVDEADRLMDIGFVRELEKIKNLCESLKQRVLLSATFPEGVESIAENLLVNPERVEVELSKEIPEGIRHAKFFVPRQLKREILAFLLEFKNPHSTLIFVQQKSEVDSLTSHLKAKQFSVIGLHGDKRQGERSDALKSFKSGETKILVATDVVARGVDIEDLSLVVNFDLPFQPEDYVHRIGRTGRKGSVGEALSLVDPSQKGLLYGIERFVGFELKELFEQEPTLEFVFPKELLEQKNLPKKPKAQKNSKEKADGAPKKGKKPFGEKRTKDPRNGDFSKPKKKWGDRDSASNKRSPSPKKSGPARPSKGDGDQNNSIWGKYK